MDLPEINKRLEHLDQLDSNEAFQWFLTCLSEDKNGLVNIIANVLPTELGDIFRREQAIGSLAQVDDMLQWFTNYKQELLTQKQSYEENV